MTRTQEQILAGLSIAISLAAIGVSLRTEHTLAALEAMRAPGPDDLVIDETPDLIHGLDTLMDSTTGTFIDPSDSGYVAGSTVWINGKLYFKEVQP